MELWGDRGVYGTVELWGDGFMGRWSYGVIGVFMGQWGYGAVGLWGSGFMGWGFMGWVFVGWGPVPLPPDRGAPARRSCGRPHPG